ncbi:MAG: DNA cytosine methyltransferase [Alphaproteobacteria bacterium]|nr:DNA cytosine methyltransferase [Alphaproteobacteria bacterium]
MLKIGELFAGVGGITTGFESAGYTVSWANEIDAKACITYRANFKHQLIEDDMRHINPNQLPKVDMIAAGFPCQAFSIAGYQKGFTDNRGNLFFDILRFIDSHQPQIVFLENVKNLVGHDDGNTFATIKNELDKRGYSTKHQVLNTCDYSNIPQNRERIYIVSFKDKQTHDNFSFPSKIEHTKPIHDFIDKTAPDEFYYNHTKYYPQLCAEMTNRDTIYQWRRKYVRENKKGMCPTLTANMGTGGHNVPLIFDAKDIRKLTPRECFRFQGFPESYILPETLPRTALYKQAGNSVSVPVIKNIAVKIKEALGNHIKTQLYDLHTTQSQQMPLENPEIIKKCL